MKNHPASLFPGLGTGAFAVPTGARTSIRRAAGVFIGLSFAALGGLAGQGHAWGRKYPSDGKSCCLNYRPSSRRGTDPDTGMSHFGYRCVLSPGQQDLKTTEKPNQTK